MAWFAAALPYIAAASTAVSAAGSIAQGNAQAKIGEFNARQATLASQAEAEQVARDTKLRLGQAKAAYAAAGVDLEGTPAAELSDLASQGELSKQLTLYRGRIQATSELFGAQQAQQAGTYTGIATLLGGAGRFQQTRVNAPTGSY